MSQLCAPGSTPLGTSPLTGPSISMSAVNAVSQQAGDLFAQIMARVLQWVQSQLEAAGTTMGQLATKVATPIVSGLNLAQQTATGIQTVVQASVAGGIASATGQTAAGQQAVAGAQPGQFKYNIYQNPNDPNAVFVVVSSAIPTANLTGLCFMGGFDDFTDALAFKSSIQGVPVPARCKLPGGVAAGPPPAACPGLYQVYQLFTVNADGTQTIIGCTIRCDTDPAPPNSTPLGNPVPLAVAQETLQGVACTGPPPPPPPPSPDWYAGCDMSGQAVTWETVVNQPAGVSAVVGPFADQATALAAEVALGTCKPPPPPSPGGMCCDPTTGAVILPACIKIDLCDWTAFTNALSEAIYQGLCKWIKDPECACKTRDSDRWILESCDGEATDIVEGWAGRIGGSVLSSGGLDGLVSAAAALLTASGGAGGTIP